MQIKVWYFLYVVLFYSVSADEEFDGTIEAYLYCPMNNFVFLGFGSRSPVFKDAVSPLCAFRGNNVCSDAAESHFFESPDGGLTLEAGCPADNQIIQRIKFRLRNTRVIAAALECCTLSEPTGESCEQEPIDSPNLARCPTGAAMQKIVLSGTATKIELGCVRLPNEIDGYPLEPLPI